MSTSATISPETEPSISPSISSDEFQALEQKVLRAIEIVRRERDARTTAEAETARLQQQVTGLEQQLADTGQRLADQGQQLADRTIELHDLEASHALEREAHTAELDHHTSTAQAQLDALQKERLDVRQRVEKMLQQMDELL